MCKVTKKFFNLIEIAMALGIIGFGVASVMSVFPAALQNANNSISQNYASNAAELFLSYLSTEAKSEPDWKEREAYKFNWATLTDLPTTKQTLDEDFKTEPMDPNSGSSGNSIYEDLNTPGLYKVVQGKKFEASVRVWRASDEQYFNKDGDAPMIKHLAVGGNGEFKDITEDKKFSDEFGDYCVAVYVELSWPSYKPYDRRESKIYVMEFFNPWSLNKDTKN